VPVLALRSPVSHERGPVRNRFADGITDAKYVELPGQNMYFEDRGTHDLKGVPGEWRLFAVASS
jgi:hypothetical protein